MKIVNQHAGKTVNLNLGHKLGRLFIAPESHVFVDSGKEAEKLLHIKRLAKPFDLQMLQDNEKCDYPESPSYEDFLKGEDPSAKAAEEAAKKAEEEAKVKAAEEAKRKEEEEEAEKKAAEEADKEDESKKDKSDGSDDDSKDEGKDSKPANNRRRRQSGKNKK